MSEIYHSLEELRRAHSPSSLELVEEIPIELSHTHFDRARARMSEVQDSALVNITKEIEEQGRHAGSLKRSDVVYIKDRTDRVIDSGRGFGFGVRKGLAAIIPKFGTYAQVETKATVQLYSHQSQ